MINNSFPALTRCQGEACPIDNKNYKIEVEGQFLSSKNHPKKHKNLQYVKEHFNYFSSKNTRNRQ